VIENIYLNVMNVIILLKVSISNGCWCPYCVNQKLCDCQKCYLKSFSTNILSDFWSDKNTISPNKVFKNTKMKYWFECYECNHSFESSLADISNGCWCPYCSNKKLCDDKNCKICLYKSFASHPKSIFWSNKNIVQPDKVFINSHNKYWFDCYECNHSFETNITNNNIWCPYCTNKKLCDCNICYNKSFASHPKSIFWSNKNKIHSNEVTKCNNNKFWFDCYHSFETQLSSISNGQWCPYCSNPPKKLCSDKKCQQCLNKSFANNPQSKFWSDKNILSPRDVFKSSSKRIIFNCDKCDNEFESQLSNISRGRWCPYCKKKTELKLFNWLKEQNFIAKTQAKFEWCKNERCLPYDFLIENLKLLIELDGPQHFEQVSNWKDPLETQLNDEKKNRLAIENGYSMIRISQEIVWDDLENWKIQLKNIIKKCIKLDKVEIIKIGSVYFKN